MNILLYSCLAVRQGEGGLTGVLLSVWLKVKLLFWLYHEIFKTRIGTVWFVVHARQHEKGTDTTSRKKITLSCRSAEFHCRVNDDGLSLLLQLHNFFSYLVDHFTPSSSKESKFLCAICRCGTSSSEGCTLYWFTARCWPFRMPKRGPRESKERWHQEFG